MEGCVILFGLVVAGVTAVLRAVLWIAAGVRWIVGRR